MIMVPRSCASCLCFRAWAQRVSQQQAVYLLGRGASINNRSASSYCCLKKWRLNPESAIINSLVWWENWDTVELQDLPKASHETVVRWCPREGDPHPVCITPILDHVSSCLQEKRLTKGMSSHTPHIPCLLDKQWLYSTGPCSSKGIAGCSTWFLMTFHTTW